MDCHRIDRFIARIARAAAPAELRDALQREVRHLGFDYLTYEMTVPPSGPRRPLFITTYPPAWSARYQALGYGSQDVLLPFAAEVARPFLWEEASRHRRLSPPQSVVFEEAREVGLRAGGLVPLHGPGPAEAYLCVANDMPPAAFRDLFHDRRHALHLLATYTHERMLRWMAEAAATPQRRPLTPRETEVLTWAARGRTHQDVADILGLTAETVKDHLGRACAKLDALNRTHAVAIALMGGLIQP